MKALKWIGIALVSVIVLVFVAGMFLPNRYTAQVVVRMNKPPEAVWAAIADYEKHPLTGAMRKRTEKLPDENGLPVWIEDAGETRIRVQVVEATAPRHIKWVFGDEAVKTMSAWSDTHITADGGGCVITTNSETNIKSGSWHVPIFRVILTLTRAHEKGVRDYWASIAAALGETARFEK